MYKKGLLSYGMLCAISLLHTCGVMFYNAIYTLCMLF